MNTSLAELYCRFKRFILFMQMKKVISMSYDSGTSNWEPWRWVRLDLTWDMYINSNLANSQNSVPAAEAPRNSPWNIRQMISKTVPISTRIVIRYAMRRLFPLEFEGKSMETEITIWSEFPKKGKVVLEPILASG